MKTFTEYHWLDLEVGRFKHVRRVFLLATLKEGGGQHGIGFTPTEAIRVGAGLIRCGIKAALFTRAMKEG